jgi:hypothetical protein
MFAMPRIVAMAVLAALAVPALGASPGTAQARQPGIVTADPEPLVRSPPQRARSSLRPRPRIKVQPSYPYRTWHSLYPLPYPYEYPGPNAVRRCTDWYVTEVRPSGTVIVPKMRCWWAQR